MPMTLTVRLDKDESGNPRKIRATSPTYRFSVVIKASDGTDAIEIEGFRIEASLRRIISPVSVVNQKSYTIVWLSPDTEKTIIQLIKDEINAQ